LFFPQDKFSECPEPVRAGGSILGLDNTRNFLFYGR
jgi:hypothetical protein